MRIILASALLIFAFSNTTFAEESKEINPPIYCNDKNSDDCADKAHKDNEPIMCTMDAKLCPDGSYVARHEPNCEFAPCPESEHKSKIKLI